MSLMTFSDWCILVHECLISGHISRVEPSMNQAREREESQRLLHLHAAGV